MGGWGVWKAKWGCWQASRKQSTRRETAIGLSSAGMWFVATFGTWEAGWLGNYQALKEAGYPVGSGMVEREVELVINRSWWNQAACSA